MPIDRMWVRSARARVWRWLVDEIAHAPLEPILHPSTYRLVWIGVFTFMGHSIFGWFWHTGIPQPYENLQLRVGMGILSLLYLLPSVARNPMSRQSGWVFGIATWIQLPWFFFYMYWMNGGNATWLSSVAAMILIYFHATDWRIASIGLISGAMAGWLIAGSVGAQDVQWVGATSSAVVISFSVIMGLMLGFSGANLRRNRLLNTLSTMGVMAHELRTPLATVNLMGDVLRNLAQNDLPESKRKKLEELSTRLQNLVRSMNRQIDTQISNAQLLRLPRDQFPIMAADLVTDVLCNYPFRSSRERDCAQVHIHQDFCFLASRPLFEQVICNLIKNALHSLASVGPPPRPGALRIEVGMHHGKGRIAISDQGMGIAYDMQQRIFEPFFSTQKGAGNGLGLSFCKNVVETMSNGQIGVYSEPARGAVFMIDLPVVTDPNAVAR